LAPYIAAKGSVAVDGVALTVNEVTAPARQPAGFEVNIVPFTLAHTSLGGLKEGGRVNLEVDMMARYAARLGAFRE
ncbi:MAG: riboflavin synthase subunit alpha, partial [Alphaproteobacteria bacterium]|nr:riboflavin synthase subunit alpha [Alphaproteobacteria bacterium]